MVADQERFCFYTAPAFLRRAPRFFYYAPFLKNFCNCIEREKKKLQKGILVQLSTP